MPYSKPQTTSLRERGEAFQAQFNYNPSSVGGVSDASQITPNWVRNLIDAKEDDKPYSAGGRFGTGQRPLNANSQASDVMFAHPTTNPAVFLSLLGWRLHNIPNFIFK